ncbi:MAG: DNA cytosine methyltransferase [Gracilibacteraceae bacterium]|nr:DNA cytosine methyltransferase [Gracilibacteraceae bacterium]
MPGGVIPFASNQRDEVRSLGVASGALVASPGMKQQTFIAEKCLTPWDVQSRRVHPENSQWPALYGAEGGGHGYAAKCLNPWDTQQSRIFIENGASPALTGADGGGGRNPGGLVAAFCGGASAQARSIGYSEDVSPTLKAEAGGFAAPCICEPEIARTLTARGDSSPCADRGQNVIAALRADVAAPCNEPHPNITGTLCASGAGLSRPAGMASEPDLCVAYALQGNMIGRREHNGPSGSGVSENLSFTLTAADTPGIAAALPISIQDKATRHNGPSRNEGGAGNGLGVGEPGDPVHTMTVGDQHAALVYDRQRSDLFRKRDVASTQAARQHKDATDLVFETGERSDQEGNRYIVRRLTPAECESLQGYMAGYTAFGCGGEKISDSRRYQMLGNSLAIPCAKFVLGNIAAQMRGG